MGTMGLSVLFLIIGLLAGHEIGRRKKPHSLAGREEQDQELLDCHPADCDHPYRQLAAPSGKPTVTEVLGDLRQAEIQELRDAAQCFLRRHRKALSEGQTGVAKEHLSHYDSAMLRLERLQSHLERP